jgi:aquaporin Z
MVRSTIDPAGMDAQGARSLQRFNDPSHEWRRVTAETWGTFLTVLVAAGGAMTAQISPEKITFGMVMLARGLSVMAVIYMLGDVSGAHLNPGVTLAFALRRNFPWRCVPGYLAAQVVGALLAVLFLRAILGDVTNLGATMPMRGLDGLRAVAMEAVLTLGMVGVILGSVSGARMVGPNAAIAVGGYVAVAGLWAFSITGASMNPFRSLAPDLLRGDFSTTWIYVAGPLLGAVLAVALEWALKGPPSKQGDEAAQGEGG